MISSRKSERVTGRKECADDEENYYTVDVKEMQQILAATEV